MKSSNTKTLPLNSVMIALNGQGKTRGSVALLRTEATCNQSLVSISPLNQNELLPEFLFYNLRMRYQELRRMTGDDGNDRRGLNMMLIRNICIPLPSLNQQREIVEKLDITFAEIDLLEKNLLKRKLLSSLMLKSALSVPYQSSKYDSPKQMKLSEIADFQGGSQPAKSNFVYSPKKDYVRFIQIRDFGSDKNLTYIPIAPKNRLCLKSDILIGRYGASVGKILTGLEGAYNVALMKVIPKSEFVEAEYLYFYLLSELFQQNLIGVSDRSAQNGFSKDDIGPFLVNVPSREEQRKVIERLRGILEGSLEVEDNIVKTKLKLISLRQSMLSSAFTQEEAVA